MKSTNLTINLQGWEKKVDIAGIRVVMLLTKNMNDFMKEGGMAGRWEKMRKKMLNCLK